MDNKGRRTHVGAELPKNNDAPVTRLTKTKTRDKDTRTHVHLGVELPGTFDAPVTPLMVIH